MTLRFGTDGVRGPAETFTDAWVSDLGRAAVRVLGGDRFVIGRDTRQSGARIAGALARGVAREGSTPEILDVAPTPSIAWHAAGQRCPAAVVSASHNPWSDNGIKLFAAGGRKLPDDVERSLEAELARLAGLESDVGEPAPLPSSPPQLAQRVLDRYRTSLAASIGGRRLEHLDVVLDCANGAASAVAPALFEELGASVGVIHATPDGSNINAGCGSTHPEDLARAVAASGAGVGLAFDGDADRVVAVDETGRTIDGDHLIAMLALDRRSRDLLPGDAVVVTVMTNLGFRLAMAEQGIEVVVTPVGDRHVLEALERRGLSLGGEQSGHVIFRDQATTGDGLLTGVQLLDLLARTGRRLSDLASSSMTRLPQVLRNVELAPNGPTSAAQVVASIAPAIAAEERRLGERGRVLVRPSGTEPLVRVMVEADDVVVAEAAAGRLVDAVEAGASGSP